MMFIMEKFYFEETSLSRKEDALAFINEFYEYSSGIYELIIKKS